MLITNIGVVDVVVGQLYQPHMTIYAYAQVGERMSSGSSCVSARDEATIDNPTHSPIKKTITSLTI